MAEVTHDVLKKRPCVKGDGTDAHETLSSDYVAEGGGGTRNRVLFR